MALLHMTFSSATLQNNVDMDVILPESTTGQIGMEGKAENTYPTLYLLHGMSDDHTIWQRRTSVERYAADLNLAIVMPSTDLGWYTNLQYGPKYWDFISDELPKVCRSFFPGMSKKREDTFVAGLSMGGYGALKCGLRASDTFSYAAGLSSALDIENKLDQRIPVDSETYWENVFGPFSQFHDSFNDLFAAAKELKASGKSLPHLYMWCGTEDFLYQDNVKFRDHLRSLNYDLVYEESPGVHAWQYWDNQIQHVLNWLPLNKEAK